MKSTTRHIDILEKHKRYKKAYGKNELYWGLGIECESYFEMEIPKQVTADFLATHHKRERYSVDYFTSYKEDILTKAFSTFEAKSDPVELPILINSHIFTKTDTNLQHKTLYERHSPPNPKFSGKTIFDLMKEDDPTFFEGQYDECFTFDGDSIEIMTQTFYKSTIEDCLQELQQKQADWIDRLRAVFTKHQILSEQGTVSWIRGNHGFAVMATNMNQLAIFNNGTYHINISLPTQLNQEGEIANKSKFVNEHRAFIRTIQWMEPLLVANFGSPDPLAWIDPHHFSAGSQRVAMSRYIGVGTFDTDTMPEGKILTTDLSGIKSTWYTEYHKTSGYKALQKVGLDINFLKHWNHGIEIRFFDWFPPARLQGLLRFLVYLGDCALETECVENPIKDPIWNAWMIRVIQKGSAAGITLAEATRLEHICGVYVSPTSNLQQVFAEIFSKLSARFKKDGPCSRYFFKKPIPPARQQETRPTVILTPQPSCKERSRCF
jgi:hypothetical protein